MRTDILPFSPPLIGEGEIAEVVDTLRSDWITTGPKVKQFELEFARDRGTGSPGCELLYGSPARCPQDASDGAGDVVITTPMTFCSGVHVIEQVGACPVLVDVQPDTLNIDPVKVREAVHRLGRDGGRVKALMPVHLYGHPCDLGALIEIASESKLSVVEDAAHSLPAGYRGRRTASMASSTPVPLVTCFSFYATKNLTRPKEGCSPATLKPSPALSGLARSFVLENVSINGVMVPEQGMVPSAAVLSSGEGGSALVRFSSGNQVNLLDSTSVTFQSESGRLSAEMSSGSLGARSFGQEPLVVETPGYGIEPLP